MMNERVHSLGRLLLTGHIRRHMGEILKEFSYQVIAKRSDTRKVVVVDIGSTMDCR